MHKLARKFKTQSLQIDNKTTHTYTINTINNQHIQPPIINTQLSTKGHTKVVRVIKFGSIISQISPLKSLIKA